MRLSQYFLPTLKEDPKEAEIASHRFMLRAGMIQQNGAGIYTWLPLGLRVLKKIEAVVRRHQDEAGAQECLMPTIQSSELWKESGRYDAYGKEMLRITDRHDREMLFGPTNEEMITDIFRSHIKSYKDLPKNLYHIQWKFRDEIRPRFGVMRGREFLMKDAYSFDLTKDDAVHAYQRMFLAYLRTYRDLGLRVIPMKADTGPIGGDLSHEFILLAETGESEVFVDEKWLSTDLSAKDIDYDNRGQLDNYFKEMTGIYAATDETHDAGKAPTDLIQTRGIEVGHIFNFGTKYSKAMGATVQTAEGKMVPVEMGSYGIGVSRLVGAIIEANHDDIGIKWPAEVAPFQVGLINLKVGDEETSRVCEDLYKNMKSIGIDVLYDDRDINAGGKFANMDLIGLPWQVIVGPKGLKEGTVELKKRATSEKHEIILERLVETLATSISDVKRGFK
ncbi:MAG: proline--tRNA ligase [Bdellovibrionales bacterium]